LPLLLCVEGVVELPVFDRRRLESSTCESETRCTCDCLLSSPSVAAAKNAKKSNEHNEDESEAALGMEEVGARERVVCAIALVASALSFSSRMSDSCVLSLPETAVKKDRSSKQIKFKS
jgi:hypothetical protein